MSQRSNMSLRLMLHKDRRRVIYAEADSDFVETLFSLMTLPLGTIIRLLEKRPDEMVKPLGSLQNLYQSLIDLPDNYFFNKESKNMMLNPRSSLYDLCSKLKLNIDDTEPIKYFVCNNFPCIKPLSCRLFSTSNVVNCTFCGNLMDRDITKEVSTTTYANGGGVFLSDVTAFIVTDDLRVMPNTSGFSIQLLNDFGITDASQLEERTLDIGREQIVILLKGALLFKFPLTYLAFYSTQSIRNVVIPHQRITNQYLTSNELAIISAKMKLKVTLQKSNSKLLFVECEADFSEFLFGFLEIPLGTVVGKLLNGNSSLETMDNLFAGITNMNDGYITSQHLKDRLLQPQLAWNSVSTNHLFSLNKSSCPQVYYHLCLGSLKISATRIYCYIHARNETYEAFTYKDPKVEGKFLKAPARFMITDDLVLTPMSSFSTIAMLNKLKVPLNDVEEYEVSIGIKEGLQILKASLNSFSVFTDALLTRNN